MTAKPDKLKPDDISPILCLTGEDLFRKLRFLAEIKEIILSAGEEVLNYEYLLGDEVDAAVILDSARTAAWDLFSGSSSPDQAGTIGRLVVIDQAEKISPSTWKTLSDYLSQPESSTCLLFLVNRQQKGWIPCKYFPKKWVRDFSPLKRRGLLNWTRREAESKQLSIPVDLLEELITTVGNDPGLIAGELEKLYLYKGPGRVITRDDIIEVVSPGWKGNIFKLTELIVTGKTDQALILLDNLINKREEHMKIFIMMVRAFRQLWKGIDAWERTGDRRSTCQAAGVRFYQDDFMRQIRELKPRDIPYIYRKLVDTDAALKGG